ncbi:polysaccharide biosynthesis protein [Halobacteriales archaeon SW_8_65_20]|nr:MAG: polysaccharide biosynthesis protein [Halobacteriales archaeon SW_8_65_20]
MRDSITKLVSISLVGGLIGRGIRYGFNVVIARGLGLEALGVFAFGMVVMKGGGVFARVGLDNAAKKFIPIHRTNDEPAKVSGTILICLVAPLLVGSALAGVLYLAYDTLEILAGTTFHPTTRLFIAGIPLISVLMVGVNATYGLKHTKYSVYIRDFGQSVAALVLMAIAAFVISDLRLLIVGYLVSITFGIVLAVVFLIREGALRFDVRPDFEYRRIFTFSLPLTLAASIQYLVSWTDVLVLGIFVPSDAVGWYQAAYQTSVLLVVVLQSANSIFPSIAADLHDSGEHDRLNRVYTAVTKWVTYLTVLGLAFVLIYNSEILSIFGTTVQSARTALVLLAVGQTINAAVGPTGFLLIMTGYERLQVINNGIIAVLNLALNLVLIQQYGIIGAAVATAFSLAVLNLLRLAQVWYLLELQPYSRGYWKGAMAIGGAVLVLLLGKTVPVADLPRMIGAGFIALCVFAVLIWAIGLDETDRVLAEAVERT